MRRALSVFLIGLLLLSVLPHHHDDGIETGRSHTCLICHLVRGLFPAETDACRVSRPFSDDVSTLSLSREYVPSLLLAASHSPRSPPHSS